MADTVPGSEPVAAAPAGTTMEKLLTPSGPQPNDGYVHLGTLRVEKGIFDQFKEAETYLGKSPEAVNLLYKLENGRTGVDVRSTSIGNDEFGSRDGRPAISWAPDGALTNTDGSKLTPAMGLVHEQGHAERWLSDPAQYNKDSQPYPLGSADRATWTTPEEKRNITGLEHRVGAELGEGSREDHHGTPYASRGPVSVELPAPAPSHEVPAVPAPAAPAHDAVPANGTVPPAHERIEQRLTQLRAEGTSLPPVGQAGASVVAYDAKAHTGSFVDIGNGQMAQNLGRGTYMVYDVSKDLGGVKPPEGVTTTVDAQGRAGAGQQPAALEAGR